MAGLLVSLSIATASTSTNETSTEVHLHRTSNADADELAMQNPIFAFCVTLQTATEPLTTVKLPQTLMSSVQLRTGAAPDYFRCVNALDELAEFMIAAAQVIRNRLVTLSPPARSPPPAQPHSL